MAQTVKPIITQADAEAVGIYEVVDCNGYCGKHIVYNLNDAIKLAKTIDFKYGRCGEFLAKVYTPDGVRIY
jgi:hypothetical protein